MEKITYYAVHSGKVPGIYQTWSDCELQVKGVKRPLFKKFDNYGQAEYYYKTGKVVAPGFDPVPSSVSKSQGGNSSTSSSSSSGGGSTEDYRLRVNKGEIAVYTDGASSNNGKKGAKAGYGIHFPLVPSLDTSRRLGPGPSGEAETNQRAELKACIEAIKIVNEHYEDDVSIMLATDSKYSMQCVYPTENKYKTVSAAWASKWSRNGWINSSGEPVKNRDLIEELYGLVIERNLDPARGRVRFVHVRGHQGIAGNEAADKLAVQGKFK